MTTDAPGTPNRPRRARHRGVLAKVLGILRAISATPARAMTLVAVLSIAGSLAVALSMRVSPPVVGDEFSYLLAADTFAHGRLTNPSHPLWRHFETLHVLSKPTWMSRYPPGSGMFLGLGQATTGMPIVGVWLACALLAAAVVWALCAFLPTRWALLGGLFVVARFGVAHYWAQSYWGGSLAALGGALLVGGVGRALARPRPLAAVATAAGLFVLSFSRPFEGAVLSIGVLTWLAASLWRRRRRGEELHLGAFLWTFVGLLALAAGAHAVYDKALTGDALLMPYTLSQRTYAVEPIFVWESKRPEPSYGNAEMRAFYTIAEPNLAWEGRSDALSILQGRIRGWVAFFVGLPLLWCLLAIPLALRRPHVAAALAILAFSFGGHLLSRFFSPHYAAPATALVVLVLVQCMRSCSRVRVPIAGRAWPVIAVVGILAFGVVSSLSTHAEALAARAAGAPGQRARILDAMRSRGGQHLIVVRYEPGLPARFEWVYNAADIDASPVIWARDLGDAANADLWARYPDRKVWRLTVDAKGEQAAFVRDPEHGRR